MKNLYLLIFLFWLLAACSKQSQDHDTYTENQFLTDSIIRVNPLESFAASSSYFRNRQLFDSLRYFEKSNNDEKILITRIELAENLRAAGSYFEGIYLLEKALESAVINQRPDLLGRTHNRLAAIYYELHHHNTGDGEFLKLAEENNKIALQMAVATNIKPYIINASIIKASILYQYGETDEAETILLHVDSLCNQYGYEHDLAWYSNMCAVLIRQGRYNEAVEMGLKFHEYTAGIRHLIGTVMSLESLAEAYEGLGNENKSHEIRQEIDRLNSKGHGIMDYFAARQLLSAYDFEQASQRVHLLSERQTYLLRQSQILYVLVGILIVILVAIYFMLKQRNRAIRLENELLSVIGQADRFKYEKQQMQLRLKEQEANNLQNELKACDNIVEAKNRLLTEKALNMVRKNEFINKVAKELMFVANDLPHEYTRKLQRLVYEMQDSRDEQMWKEFETRFVDVHNDFYKALNKSYPELTSGEKKLAAFLRLNMSSKDIAAITGQSPDSIKVARGRLRKKLGLATDDNLVAFLEGLQFNHKS